MFPPPQPPSPSAPPPPPPPLTVSARQLSFSKSSPPTPVTGFLFDPTSLSLALSHSDSSFSLYPSIPSPLSLSSVPPPQTLISPPSSSATFLHLTTTSNTSPTFIFLVSSSTLGGSANLLRFYLLNSSTKSFKKAKITSNHRDISFDEENYGIVYKVIPGVSVKLVGSTNFFALYSVSNAKIWVFAVKLIENDVLKLMKCAVMDCFCPIYSISVSLGYLILGEEYGVRVFPFRPLAKGRVKKEKKDKKNNFQNTVIHGINGVNGTIISSYTSKNTSKNVRSGKVASLNGKLEQKREKHSDSVKLTSLKLRQDSKEMGSCYVALKSKEDEFLDSTKMSRKSPKVICIRSLSLKKFLILDSFGELYILSLSSPIHGSEISSHIQKLTQSLRIQKFAVFSDPSSNTPYVWISDGQHTIHMMEISEVEPSGSESDKKDIIEQQTKASVVQAIFVGDKIQEIAALTPNAVLILGAGSMFAYDIS